MRRHEMRPRNAVAVEKEDICAGALANTAIADIGQPKAAILVPHMLDREPRSPFTHDAGCGRARAVIGNDDFEIAIGLAR